MDPVRKALWFVEGHSREPVTLEDIARACHVSAYHLTRAFAAATGLSLMRYVRARRLTEAAHRLALGADDILGLALDIGYGSHEAFTRAFRELFAATPEQVRASGRLDDIPLVEAITMTTTPAPDLAPPRFETLKPTLFAGVAGRHNCQAPAGIPDQWQRFTPYLGTVPGRLGDTAYGVCYNFDRDGNFDYLCAVEVAGDTNLPTGLTSLHVPAHRYAVFTHRGHVAGVRATITAIWNKWFPESGYKPTEAPTIERYGPEFDPRTGLGGFEIWVAVQD
jgi:AraC family transcriptional regulator